MLNFFHSSYCYQYCLVNKDLYYMVWVCFRILILSGDCNLLLGMEVTYILDAYLLRWFTLIIKLLKVQINLSHQMNFREFLSKKFIKTFSIQTSLLRIGSKFCCISCLSLFLTCDEPGTTQSQCWILPKQLGTGTFYCKFVNLTVLIRNCNCGRDCFGLLLYCNESEGDFSDKIYFARNTFIQENTPPLANIAIGDGMLV